MKSEDQPQWVQELRAAVGARIRDRREQLNLTQIELCYVVGVDRTTYQRFESGLSDPHLGELLLIADALAIPLEALAAVKRHDDGPG